MPCPEHAAVDVRTEDAGCPSGSAPTRFVVAVVVVLPWGDHHGIATLDDGVRERIAVLGNLTVGETEAADASRVDAEDVEGRGLLVSPAGREGSWVDTVVRSLSIGDRDHVAANRASAERREEPSEQQRLVVGMGNHDGRGAARWFPRRRRGPDVVPVRAT